MHFQSNKLLYEYIFAEYTLMNSKNKHEAYAWRQTYFYGTLGVFEDFNKCEI